MTRKKTPVRPYKLMMVLLYGQHKWIERDGATIRVPNARCATHMRTRANKIREYLYELENWGFIDKVRWNPYWFSITPRMPVGMAWSIGGSAYVSYVSDNDQTLETETIDV